MIPKDNPKDPPAAHPPISIGETTLATIIAERARFHRFIVSQIGDDVLASLFLKTNLLPALQQSGKLRRGESAVAWFYRILCNAIFDYHANLGPESRRLEHLRGNMQDRGTVSKPPSEWDTAVRACFLGLLPSLEPRYAQVVCRVDLRGEPKGNVAREMKLSAATMDVLLHRARQALRKRLEIFCGASSRERCLEDPRQ